MALSRPTCVSTRATAATSPIQEGSEGVDSGVIWMSNDECVILCVCPPYLERDQLTSSLVRRHLSLLLSSFPLFLLSYAISLRIPWGCASHLRPQADGETLFQWQTRRAEVLGKWQASHPCR